MKPLFLLTLAILLCSCNDEVGRFQLIDSKQGHMNSHPYTVFDTKTGTIYRHHFDGDFESDSDDGFTSYRIIHKENFVTGEVDVIIGKRDILSSIRFIGPFDEVAKKALEE